MLTAYITHQEYLNHYHPHYDHPEHPGRIEVVWHFLDQSKLLNRMKCIEPQPVAMEWIRAVHTERHVAVLEWTAEQDRLTLIDADTYALPSSYAVARLSAGGVVAAIEQVLTQQVHNALAVVRPPGHHATPDTAMGFCLLNNVAIGARYAQQAHGVSRVMVLDFDVHHGNGTQDCFVDDDSVLFISIHQSPFYPGTGHVEEVGIQAGEGYTMNIPVFAGYGDANYNRIFEELVWEAARRFQPELILVSAGFDAHWVDPLAMVNLSLQGYAHMTESLIQMAEELCDGKIVFVMEGGYDLRALAAGITNVAHLLVGDVDLVDPYGPSKSKEEPNPDSMIAKVKQIHQIK